MKAWQILLLVGTVASAQATLSVVNFAQLDDSAFDAELLNIPYSIANFGFSP